MHHVAPQGARRRSPGQTGPGRGAWHAYKRLQDAASMKHHETKHRRAAELPLSGVARTRHGHPATHKGKCLEHLGTCLRMMKNLQLLNSQELHMSCYGRCVGTLTPVTSFAESMGSSLCESFRSIWRLKHLAEEFACWVSDRRGD